MKVAIVNIFTIIKTNLFRINNSLNNKYLVDSYYLILFISITHLRKFMCFAIKQAWGY